jgi:hypothetical protein
LTGVSSGAGKIARSPSVLLSILLSVLLTGGALMAAPLHPLPQSTSNKNSSNNGKDYALIFGTVWGPDSRPVSGVPVRIRRTSEKKFRWDLVSNHMGEFAQRVPVGTQDYVIEADIKTPKGVPKPEIKVHIDDNERQDVGIHLTEQQLGRPSE